MYLGSQAFRWRSRFGAAVDMDIEELAYSPSPPSPPRTPPVPVAVTPPTTPPTANEFEIMPPPVPRAFYKRIRTADGTELYPLEYTRTRPVVDTAAYVSVPMSESTDRTFIDLADVGSIPITFREHAAVTFPETLAGHDDDRTVAREALTGLAMRMTREHAWTARAGTTPSDLLVLTDFDGRRIVMHHVIASGSYGAAMSATYTRAGTNVPCVVKMVPVVDDRLAIDRQVFRDCVNEIMVHTVLSRIQDTDTVVRAKQASHHMARVPKLHAAGVVLHNMIDVRGRTFLRTGARVPYVFLVMDAYEQTLGVAIHRDPAITNETQRTAVTAAATYQVVNLLRRLGHLCQFNHRDLKIDNVMIRKVPGATGGICGFPQFETALIDFGMARIQHNGRVVGSAADTMYTFAHTFAYNPAVDLMGLVTSIRYHTNTRVKNGSARNTLFDPVFDHVLKMIVHEAGMSTVASFNPSWALYNRYYLPTNAVVNPAQVMEFLKVVLRYIRDVCTGTAAARDPREVCRTLDLVVTPSPTEPTVF